VSNGGSVCFVITVSVLLAFSVYEEKINFLIPFSNTVRRTQIFGSNIDCSRGSSGSIVSDYGLDDRAIEVRSPTGADFSSSLCVQTDSGAHPASYPMGTGGNAWLGRDADHSPPSSAEVKNE
jgi:hypothetical protein